MRCFRRLARFYYGPPDYFVSKFSSRDRRAFGFWILIVAIIGVPIFGRAVLYVTILSVVALVPNYTSETPVETELDDEDDHS
jgi:hypothetical protein